jgi:integrase
MAIHLLSADKALTRRDGRYDDGGGVWLIVRNRGHSAVYFFEYNGKLVGEKGWQHVSLGPRKKTSLSKARDRGELCRELLDEGISPKENWRRREHKAAREKEGASLTVGEAIEGRANPEFVGFMQWGPGRAWDKQKTTDHKRWVVDNYLKPSALWDMPVASVEVEHVITLLDPYWRSRPPTGKRIQSFGLQLFKWLRIKKLYTDVNPFYGGKDGDLVQGLGGPQPPSGNLIDPEPDDLPLVMAHLRIPPTHGDDVWTVGEVATAAETAVDTIRKLIHRGYFPGAYKWADWGTATYLIPREDIRKAEAEGVLRLKHPLKKQIEVSIESLAVQFTLMTVVRPHMTCDLKWDFIKWKRGLITYPDHKTRGKVNDEYNVVLTEPVEEILHAAKAYQERHSIQNDDYVFVKGWTRTGINAYSNELVKKNTLWRTFKILLARIPDIEKRNATLHAARTSFVTWAVDRNDYPPQVADVALGHAIKGIKNKMYFKNVKYYRQIQEMVTGWQRFLLSKTESEIEPIPFKSQPRLANFPNPAHGSWNRRP